MENKKIDLETNKMYKHGIDMKREYEEFKNLLLNDKLENCPKSIEKTVEKKWLETKMPLLKRQLAFNKSEPLLFN